MRLHVALVLGSIVAMSAGCGTSPASLLVGDGSGSLDVLLNPSVDSQINLNVDANVVADVNCVLECDLNTGECETVCELDEGIPPTPEELGQELYLANCSACHGDPVGTGFAPDITGESADEILAMFNSGSHPGGQFPTFTQEDIDNIAAFLAAP